MSDEQTLREVLDNLDAGRRELAEYHDTFDDNYAFLYKFDHYSALNANERDRRRSKPRGRQLASKHRHKLAQVMKQALYISTRPVDDETDPGRAEQVRWFMEYEVNDPQKRFRRVMRRAVSLALGAGAGAIGLKARYDLGPYPEVRPYLVDPRSVVWTPGWQEPDDDTCPWVIFDEAMRIADVESMKDYGWKNTGGLRSEAIEHNQPGRLNQNTAQPLASLASSAPQPGRADTKDRLRIVFCWYRFDSSTYSRDTKEIRDIEPAQRYMACPACPYRDFAKPGAELAEYGDLCPECSALGAQRVMERVDKEVVTEDVLRYARGKRLVIAAPDQRRVFYDDAWPYSMNGRPMRNVPLAWFKGYDLPLEPWGSCDTDWDFSYQVIANATDRRLYEWITRAGGVLVSGMGPDGHGLFSANGAKPFEFTDRPISLALWKGMGQPQVQYFQPHGMVGELLPFMNYWNGQFRADMGISDLGLTPERSKDIPATTVRQLTATGEIPVDDHAEQIRESLSSFYGVWYDMKRALMTERQMVRLRGDDGTELMKTMRGEEMPNADVIVGAPPRWDDFDAERLGKFQALMSPPPGMDPATWSRMMPIMAEVAGIPMELVEKLQRAMTPPQIGAPGTPAMAAPGTTAPVGNGAPMNGLPDAVAARLQGMGGMGPPVA